MRHSSLRFSSDPLLSMTPLRYHHCILRRLLASVLPLSAQLWAQTTAPKDKEDVVVLSPFTVNTTRDVGYEASSSLAGTGLNTKLTDLGASVAVVTAKFLQDTASTWLQVCAVGCRFAVP